MEGLRRPPKATHPFPSNPDLRKFWNAPTGKAYFKVTATFLVVYGSIAGLQLYLTRNDKGVLGVDLTMTEEQSIKRMEILKSGRHSKLAGPGLFLNQSQELKNPALRFDDGAGFNRYSSELPFSGKKIKE